MKFKNIISLILGIAVSIVLFKFVISYYLICIPAGIAAFIFSRKMIKALILKQQGSLSKLVPAEERVKEIIKDGMKKLSEIRQQSIHIKKNVVAFKIKDICKVGVEIFDVLKKNPNDARRAKQFINYYLDATVNIVKKYVELSRRKDQTEEVRNSLSEVENTLDSIKETYEKQLANLYEDDLLDLNTEISLLKRTMKLQK